MKKNKTYTLVEVVAVVAVIGFLFSALGGFFYTTIRSWNKQKTTLDLIQNSREAFDLMISELRLQEPSNPAWITGDTGANYVNIFIFTIDIDTQSGGWGWDRLIRYHYEPADHTIYRHEAGDWWGWWIFAWLLPADSGEPLITNVVNLDIAADRPFRLSNRLMYVRLKLRANPDQPASEFNPGFELRTVIRANNL